MFELANNEKIGIYLKEKIGEKFEKQRHFCKRYLECTGKELNDDEIRKVQNRLIQIIKGNKSIQIYDLPIFCELLDVTCEEILSAGENFAESSKRMTNYSIAFSNDENEWLKYINREDKLIVNSDEYGNTVIDYAIKFKNYKFLKFLIEKGFIWFDCGDLNEYAFTFGAGTSIEKRKSFKIDNSLQYNLEMKDELRKEIIALAVQNKDIDILDKMRARELPTLYVEAHYLSGSHPNIKKYYNKNLVNSIIEADYEIIDYFTDEFKIIDHVKYKDKSKRCHTFMFPFISDVVNGLINNNNGFTEIALKKIISHNQKTYDSLISLIDNCITTNLDRYNIEHTEYYEKVIKPQMVESLLKRFEYYDDGNIVSFSDTLNTKGIITNIVYVDAESSNPLINHLIEELNNLFDKIVNIKMKYISNEEN